MKKFWLIIKSDKTENVAYGVIDPKVYDNIREATHKSEDLTRKTGKPHFVFQCVGECALQDIERPIIWDVPENN